MCAVTSRARMCLRTIRVRHAPPTPRTAPRSNPPLMRPARCPGFCHPLPPQTVVKLGGRVCQDEGDLLFTHLLLADHNFTPSLKVRPPAHHTRRWLCGAAPPLPPSVWACCCFFVWVGGWGGWRSGRRWPVWVGWWWGKGSSDQVALPPHLTKPGHHQPGLLATSPPLCAAAALRPRPPTDPPADRPGSDARGAGGGAPARRRAVARRVPQVRDCAGAAAAARRGRPQGAPRTGTPQHGAGW